MNNFENYIQKQHGIKEIQRKMKSFVPFDLN